MCEFKNIRRPRQQRSVSSRDTRAVAMLSCDEAQLPNAGARGMTIGSIVVTLLAVLACDEPDPKRAPDPPVVAAVRSGATERMPEGKNVVSGSADSKPFQNVAASWVIESPDAEGSTVVYLFSTPVRCVDLSFSGWDRALEDGTTILAIEVFGKEPGSYLTLPTPTPSQRAAAVAWMRPSQRGASVDVRASGGWVTLDAISTRSSVRGSFALSFGRGTFERPCLKPSSCSQAPWRTPTTTPRALTKGSTS